MGIVNAPEDPLAVRPDLIGQVVTRSYGRVWKPIDQEEVARLTVVGIGPIGARTIQILSRVQPDLSCHEIRFDPRLDELSEMEAVLTMVRTSDLLFVVSGFDDAHCEMLFSVVADTATKVGVPTIGVVPDNQEYLSVLPFVTSIWPVSYSSFCGELDGVTPSVGSEEDRTVFALRHTVSTMTDLLTHNGIIGIDYDEVVSVLKSGTIGKLAVGVGDVNNGRTASRNAIIKLEDQKNVSNPVKDLLVSVSGSSLMTMDHFDEESKVIYDRVHTDADIIIGLFIDDSLGKNLMVTVLTINN